MRNLCEQSLALGALKSRHGVSARIHNLSTPVGFEPTRGDPIGLAGRRLSHSAKVSLQVSFDCRRFTDCNSVSLSFSSAVV